MLAPADLACPAALFMALTELLIELRILVTMLVIAELMTDLTELNPLCIVYLIVFIEELMFD